MKDTKAAFKWIINILQKHNVLFQVSGGLAARQYGSTRELADIDIDIEENGFKKILPDVKNYVIFGPKQFTDENWNLQLMTLEYKNQLIDLSGKGKIFDKNKKEWVNLETNFLDNNQIIVYNITVPVVTKENLIAYKSKLQREVDKKDIKAIISS